ncbi:hypothetical protein D3C86_1891310 [compost metagenome]
MDLDATTRSTHIGPVSQLKRQGEVGGIYKGQSSDWQRSGRGALGDRVDHVAEKRFGHSDGNLLHAPA